MKTIILGSSHIKFLYFIMFTTSLFITSSLSAAEVFHISKGSSWKYFKGTEPPSDPPDGWISPEFDDSSWSEGHAPFGYDRREDYDFGTELLDMSGSYITLFLRQRFEIPDASSVSELEIRIFYDDGFAAWINGTEVKRDNVPDGDIPFDVSGTPLSSEPTEATFDLPDPSGYLVSGTNVITVVMVNRSMTSSDFMFDLSLVDPVGIDEFPPVVEKLFPASDTTVRSIEEIKVTFSEDVINVDAEDLLVNGDPAQSLSGSGRGPYVFGFQEPPVGTVNISWAADHGITDTAPLHNKFAGGSWSFTLDPDAPPGDIVINEILASNRNGLLDEDNENSDWIEIYNRGSEQVNLNGWGLTDNPAIPAKWTFPDITINPDEYIIVFASGKNRAPENGELHTNFQLDASGEYLGLYSPDSPPQVIDEFNPLFPLQRPDYSYGLDGNGQLHYFETPTPGEENNIATALDGFVADTKFSINRGFYDQSFEVAITCETEGSEIRYTTNGIPPGPDYGTVYTAPVTIDKTTVLRAIAYKDNFIPSNVDTQTYIFISEVLKQPFHAPGFPTSWGSAPSVDYGMDPEVVDDPVYSSDLVEGLLSIPSVSIVCDPDDMFGPNGLYSNPTREGPGGNVSSYEKAASIELIYPDKNMTGFQENAGLRIQGGASRNPNKSPKHSFRILFKDEYGPTRLRYPLFPGSPVINFDTFTLRANYNNSWIHWDSGQRSRAQFIRDQWARDTQLDMGQVSSHGMFVHLYLDGLYWGLYNLVERPSAPFAADYFGGEKEDYDALNSATVINGDSAAWNYINSFVSSNNMSVDANYQKIQEYLDVPALIDYMIINIYGANGDWPQHNWYAARKREDGAQYRFFSWDAERILENKFSNNSNVSTSNSPALFYSRLSTNSEFRLLFADHLHKHFFNGGAMTPEAVAERWIKRSDEIDKAVIGESARWGDYRRDVHSSSNGPYEFYRRNTHWIPEQNRLLNDYFPSRSAIVLNQFKSRGLYPKIDAPEFNQHGGTIEEGFELSMEIPAGTTGIIYYSLDGTDPRLYGSGAIAPEASEYSGPIILNEPALVKARVLSDGSWSALNEAMFHIQRPLEALKITEIMYNPPDSGDIDGEHFEFIELKNTGEKLLDLSGVSVTDGIWYKFPEGTTLGPGEFFVLASDVTAFQEKYPDFQGYLDSYWRNLSDSGDTIRLEDPGENEFFAVTFLDLGAWPAKADGQGNSIVPVDPQEAEGDPNMPGFWRASTLAGGSPGTDDPVEAPLGGLQLPGDFNQDGSLNLSDAISNLLYLFGGKTDSLPCEKDTADGAGNIALLDINKDQKINLGDVIYLLSYLFMEGPAPGLGTVCVRIEGCPNACSH